MAAFIILPASPAIDTCLPEPTQPGCLMYGPITCKVDHSIIRLLALRLTADSSTTGSLPPRSIELPS